MLKNNYETTLDKAKSIKLNILNDVDEVCNNNYILACGTLLGAFRYGSFIPWDDDVDIYMSREDYNRFKQVAIDELPSNFFYQTTDTYPKYSLTFAKIRDISIVFNYLRESILDLEYHQGMFIDVFPIDLVSGTKKYVSP